MQSFLVSVLVACVEPIILFGEGDQYKEKASILAGRCFDISQYINRLEPDPGIFGNAKHFQITYHNPCHLRAAGLHQEPEKLFERFTNAEIIHPIDADRCCGQAGSYGFLHYREAKQMFRKKKEDYKAIEADYIMTSCPACQMKIRAETDGNFRVVHPVEILAEMIE